uniref:Calponin-homology (CH) domain-containing protein n=1 Tax=Salix viminalis TaxID=40686 RepID=A0A6N2K2I6_SALVM
MERNLSPLRRKELANLDKDSDSRKSAMKALKSYVKGLDSKAIPQFLAQVSETRLGLCPVNIQFHCMKFLLVSMEVIVTVSRWMPLAVYWGKLGMHFWTAVAFKSHTINTEKQRHLCSLPPLCFSLFTPCFELESFRADIEDNLVKLLQNEGLLSRVRLASKSGIIDELAVNIRAHGIGCAVVNITTQDLVEGRAKMNKSCDLLDEVSFGANVPCFSSILLISAENNLSPQVANQLGGIKSEDALFLKLGWIRWLLNRTSSLTYAVIAPGFHALYLEATVKVARPKLKPWAEAISLDYLVADGFVALAIPRDVELYECPCLLINGCKMSLCRFSSAAWSQKYKGKAIVGDLPPVMGKLKAFIFNKEETSGILNELYADLSNEIEFENFLKLINIAVPGIVDERAVSTKRVLNPWKRNENHTLCLNSAKAIGCTVVNIGTQHLVEGRPHLLLGLISLIIKAKMNKSCDLLDEVSFGANIIAHTKENVVKKQGLTCDEMEADREEIIAHTKENVVKKQGLTCDEMEAEREEFHHSLLHPSFDVINSCGAENNLSPQVANQLGGIKCLKPPVGRPVTTISKVNDPCNPVRHGYSGGV